MVQGRVPGLRDTMEALYDQAGDAEGERPADKEALDRGRGNVHGGALSDTEGNPEPQAGPEAPPTHSNRRVVRERDADSGRRSGRVGRGHGSLHLRAVPAAIRADGELLQGGGSG